MRFWFLTQGYGELAQRATVHVLGDGVVSDRHGLSVLGEVQKGDHFGGAVEAIHILGVDEKLGNGVAILALGLRADDVILKDGKKVFDTDEVKIKREILGEIYEI